MLRRFELITRRNKSFRISRRWNCGSGKDIDAKVAEAALRKWVETNKWSPAISEIREMASSIQSGDLPDWGEGWEKVINAIRHFGMYEAVKALESFDPITRQCVERLGYTNLCLSENIAADRANFRIIFEQVTERKRKDAQIALPLKQTIHAIQGNQNLMIEGETQ